MKTALFVAVLLGIPAGAARAQQVVPMHREPRHHLVLERPTFQVVDARIPPGDTTLFHTHDAPIHYVTISTSSTTSQVLGREWPEVNRGAESPRPVGSATWSLRYAVEPLTHRVANIGNGLYRLIAVTNLTRGRSNVAPVDAGPAALPGSVEAESEWFRRARLTLQPGEQVRVRGSDSPPVVAIQVTEGQLELLDGAIVLDTGATTGDWLVAEGASEQFLRNAGRVSVTVVLVQVQS